MVLVTPGQKINFIGILAGVELILGDQVHVAGRIIIQLDAEHGSDPGGRRRRGHSPRRRTARGDGLVVPGLVVVEDHEGTEESKLGSGACDEYALGEAYRESVEEKEIRPVHVEVA